MDQVEFHVAPPPVQLPLALRVCPGRVHAPLQYWRIGLEKPIAHAAHEGERLLEAPIIKVIVKKPAHSARLLAMGQIKIVVTPFLQARVDILTKGVTSGLGGGMPMNGIFFIAIVRRQVEPASHPPHRLLAGFLCHEHAYIGMRRRRVRVAGVDDQRNTHGPKAASGEFRTVLCGRRWHARANHMRKVHAALFDHIALSQYPADAATAFRPIPGFSSESRATVDGLKLPADLVLK